MKKIFLIFIALLFTACGGSGAVQNTTQEYDSYDSYESPDLSRFMDKDYVQFTQERFPSLYEAYKKNDYRALSSMLGTMDYSFMIVGSGGNEIYGIQTRGTTGDLRTREDLLYYAMKQGDLDLARALLEEGADPNNTNGNGLTPVQVVFNTEDAIPDKLKFVDILIRGGADLNRKAVSGMPTVHFVAGSDITDKRAVLKKLMSYGLDINQTDDRGNTALYAAYRYANDQQLAGLLLELGVDIGKGKSILAIALSSEVPDKETAINTLLAHGADPNLKDRDGQPVMSLIIASRLKNKAALIDSLLAHGADPNVKDKEGTPLLNLALNSDIEDKAALIGALVEHGADPDQTDNSGNTALHLALNPRFRYLEGISEETIISWVEPMIQSGADLNVRNDQGKTVLTYASPKLATYLRENGAADTGQDYELDASLPSADKKKENIFRMDSWDLLSLKREDCFSMLRDHDVEFEVLSNVEGVEMPIRLTSKIGDISFRHAYGSEKFSIMDCRLAAALAGWVPVLREFGVVEVEHMRTYSPGARVGGGPKISGHNYALAIDASRFILNDGTILVVAEDWTDKRRGANPCESLGQDESRHLSILRGMACEANNISVFSMILTPHYNKAHYDHLHMELTKEGYDLIH